MAISEGIFLKGLPFGSTMRVNDWEAIAWRVKFLQLASSALPKESNADSSS